MERRLKRPIYDLNKPEDRAYLLKRGFVWAVSDRMERREEN